MAGSYVIEGVDFLPAQIAQLSGQYPIKSVFLGCSKITLERFDQFPGHSPGYANLPENERQQFVHDIPLWSDYVRQETKRFSYPFIDMIDDFTSRQNEAETLLIDGIVPEAHNKSE